MSEKQSNYSQERITGGYGMKLVSAVLLYMLIATTQAADSHHDASTQFKQIKVVDGIYMLQGKGGNVGVFVGADGMLVVDDEYDSMSEALEKELQKLGGDKIQFLFNTHWHGDHTGGNKKFGRDTHIVAHENVRERLRTRQEVKLFNMVQEPLPEDALPDITFLDAITFHFNNDKVSAVHYPRGHTDGDIVIYFEKANVVHMGDHYFAGMFPFVDVDSGGNVLAMARNIGDVLHRLPADAKVIPGHGPLSSVGDLKNYYTMLWSTTGIVFKLKKQGKSVAQIQEQGLGDKWKAWGKGFISEKNWISFIYRSLESEKDCEKKS